ncbi:hypothetical protein N799_09875 [Lysobacter arseniciresistens ZS79]|uniref:Uncharacterized protein n=1 Tax=Lysobacter arseniciresistens ZS79 TaxID=913325 RepID=A0A0A0EUF9_9GAMM|nr:hypothetical protein [Lysobacter arseniciresistens]KGM54179.1 hypothetical protein N799_09875 [Lysobacter arseniciresistens ZS79]
MATENSTVEQARTDDEREMLRLWRAADDTGRARIRAAFAGVLSGQITPEQVRTMQPAQMVAMLDTLAGVRA